MEIQLLEICVNFMFHISLISNFFSEIISFFNLNFFTSLFLGYNGPQLFGQTIII